MNDKIDQLLAKETELQEELIAIQRTNQLLDEELAAFRDKEKDLETHSSQLVQLNQDLIAKDEKRESYIKALEKQLRHAKDEAEKLSKTTQASQDMYSKMRELERDASHLSEQNGFL